MCMGCSTTSATCHSEVFRKFLCQMSCRGSIWADHCCWVEWWGYKGYWLWKKLLTDLKKKPKMLGSIENMHFPSNISPSFAFFWTWWIMVNSIGLEYWSCTAACDFSRWWTRCSRRFQLASSGISSTRRATTICWSRNSSLFMWCRLLAKNTSFT